MSFVDLLACAWNVKQPQLGLRFQETNANSTCCKYVMASVIVLVQIER